MGHRGCHRQGSLSLAGHIQKERRETKVEPSFFTVWKRTRTLDEPDPDRKGSMWVSDGSELRYTEYCKKLGEMRGTDVDPLSVPFDPEAQVEEQNKLREEAEARAQRMEEQMMLHQQQLAQQQKTMEWMTEQMSQQRDHMRMLAMQPGGVTLPPLAPPPFTFPWAPPSSGSNNMPLGGLGNQEGTPPVPPMAGSHVVISQV
ncbi:hypothetical protein QYE76_051621 [Lolium multiflorum]|uniref:Uncharacterized protein n=1 Tax=Lolium multiflorum TaxID=4521 RepID=A0AAD8SS71_LOLMU|nr:hypothetical protein QYE76_051621 [Lolium multiflorum]